MAESIQIQKVSWWHEAIVDWELANPEKTMNECAAHFTVTPTWLSIVRNSDAFISYRAARMGEHHDNVSRTTIERVGRLADLSAEILEQRLVAQRDTISNETLLDTAKMALKAMGFGQPRAPNGMGVTNNILVIGREDLHQARTRMRAFHAQGSTAQVIDGGSLVSVQPASDSGPREPAALTPAA